MPDRTASEMSACVVPYLGNPCIWFNGPNVIRAEKSFAPREINLTILDAPNESDALSIEPSAIIVGILNISQKNDYIRLYRDANGHEPVDYAGSTIQYSYEELLKGVKLFAESTHIKNTPYRLTLTLTLMLGGQFPVSKSATKHLDAVTSIPRDFLETARSRMGIPEKGKACHHYSRLIAGYLCGATDYTLFDAKQAIRPEFSQQVCKRGLSLPEFINTATEDLPDWKDMNICQKHWHSLGAMDNEDALCMFNGHTRRSVNKRLNRHHVEEVEFHTSEYASGLSLDPNIARHPFDAYNLLQDSNALEDFNVALYVYNAPVIVGLWWGQRFGPFRNAHYNVLVRDRDSDKVWMLASNHNSVPSRGANVEIYTSPQGRAKHGSLCTLFGYYRSSLGFPLEIKW